MAHIEFYRCDNCGESLVNAECDPHQLGFTLVENGDFGAVFHFCNQKCLSKFVGTGHTKWKKRINKGEIPGGMTLGEFQKLAKWTGDQEREIHEALMKNSHPLIEKLHDLWAYMARINIDKKITKKQHEEIRAEILKIKSYLDNYSNKKEGGGL